MDIRGDLHAARMELALTELLSSAGSSAKMASTPCPKCQGAGIDKLKFQLDAHSRQASFSKPVFEHGRVLHISR